MIELIMDFDLKDASKYFEGDLISILRNVKELLQKNDFNNAEILIKSIQILRNSLVFNKFPISHFDNLLDALMLCFNNDLHSQGNIVCLVGLQLLHNFLCSQNDFKKFENVLLDIINALIAICQDNLSSDQFKGIFWLILYTFSSKVFSGDFISLKMNENILLEIFNASDETCIENGNILLSYLIEKSNKFLEQCFNISNNKIVMHVLYFIDEANINLSKGNLEFIIDYLLMKVNNNNDFLKEKDQIQLDIVSSIFLILSNQINIGEMISFEKQCEIIKSYLEVLRILQLYDENPEESEIYKSQYSHCKNKIFQNRPIYNLKIYIIKLVSNLASENMPIRNYIVELGGLEQIMSNTRIDLCNPHIQQYSIFAIRNICLGNQRACERVMSITRTDDVDDKLLDILNYTKIERDGVKMYLPKK